MSIRTKVCLPPIMPPPMEFPVPCCGPPPILGSPINPWCSTPVCCTNGCPAPCGGCSCGCGSYSCPQNPCSPTSSGCGQWNCNPAMSPYCCSPCSSYCNPRRPCPDPCCRPVCPQCPSPCSNPSACRSPCCRPCGNNPCDDEEEPSSSFNNCNFYCSPAAYQKLGLPENGDGPPIGYGQGPDDQAHAGSRIPSSPAYYSY